MKNNILAAVACLLAPVSFAGEMNLPDGYEVVSSEEASMVIANTSTHGLMSYNRILLKAKNLLSKMISQRLSTHSAVRKVLFLIPLSLSEPSAVSAAARPSIL